MRSLRHFWYVAAVGFVLASTGVSQQLASNLATPSGAGQPSNAVSATPSTNPISGQQTLTPPQGGTSNGVSTTSATTQGGNQQTGMPSQGNSWIKTAILLIAINIVAGVIVCAITYRKRAPLVDLLRKSAVSRAVSWSVDPALAIILSVFASLFDLFRPASYVASGAGLIVGGSLWSVAMWLYLSSKVIAEFVKNKDQDEIKSLKSELDHEHQRTEKNVWKRTGFQDCSAGCKAD